MKNVLWYIGFNALIFVEIIVLLVAIANIALPIVFMIWLRNAWWLCLWSAEPIMLYLFVLLDNVSEDM